MNHSVTNLSYVCCVQSSGNQLLTGETQHPCLLALLHSHHSPAGKRRCKDVFFTWNADVVWRVITGVRCKLSSRDILSNFGCKRYDDNPTSFSCITNTSKRSDIKTSMHDVILTWLFGCMCKLTLHDILTYFGCQNMTIHVHLLLSLQTHPARATLRRLCRTSNWHGYLVACAN